MNTCHCHQIIYNGNPVKITEDCDIHRNQKCDGPCFPTPHHHTKTGDINAASTDDPWPNYATPTPTQPLQCVGCYLEAAAGQRQTTNPATLIVGGNSTCESHVQIGPAPAIPGRTASGIIIGEQP